MTRKSRDENLAVIYLRVSTDDQHVSLEHQEAQCRRYCDWRGLRVAGVYSDEAVSGGKPLAEREQGAALCRALSTAGAVVALKLDRLFRSASDATTTAEAWVQQGVALHIVDQGGAAMDTRTSNGWLCFAMLANIAQYERMVIGERTSAGLQHRKQAGVKYCRSVYGYDSMPGQDQGGTATRVNAREQAVIQRMVGLHVAGQSYAAIAATLNAERVRTKRGGAWSASTVHGIVKRAAGPIAVSASIRL